MAAVCHLVPFGGLLCASSCQISCRSTKPLRRYGPFSILKMAAVRHLRFVVRLLGPPMEHSWRFYRCAKFGWNRRYSFEDIRFLMLCEFGLKMLNHSSFWGILGKSAERETFCNFIPLGIQKPGIDVLWTKPCQNRYWTRAKNGVTKKKENFKNWKPSESDISPICWDAPLRWSVWILAYKIIPPT